MNINNKNQTNMKLELSNLLSEGNVKNLNDICSYIYEDMPVDNEQYEIFRTAFKLHLEDVHTNVDGYCFEYITGIAKCATTFATINAEYEKGLQTYADIIANASRTIKEVVNTL
jgi:hypothetical protein